MKKKVFLSLGSLGPPEQWEAQPALLPLTPTEQLEDHRSALGSGDAGFSLLQNPSVPMDLFAPDPSQDFFMGFGAEENPNLLTQDLVDSLERSPHPENVLRSNDVTAFQAGNAGTPDHLESPSGDFLFGEDDVEDVDGLPSSLNELMEDAALLDEIGLLDLALEEGFSPEMAARLDEAGYPSPDVVQQEPGTDQILSQPDLSGDQVPPGDSQQGSHVRPWKSFGAVFKLFLCSLKPNSSSSPHQTARRTQTRTLVCLWTSATVKLLRVLLKPPPIPLPPPLTRLMTVLSRKMRTPRGCAVVVVVPIWRWR